MRCAWFNLTLPTQLCGTLAHRGESNPRMKVRGQTVAVICDFQAQPALERKADATVPRLRMPGNIRQCLQRDVISRDLNSGRQQRQVVRRVDRDLQPVWLVI